MTQPTAVTPEIKLEDLVRVPGVQGFDLSPDGAHAVIVWNTDGSPQLFIVALNGEANPRQITTGPQAALGPRWSPLGDLIAFTRDAGGDENADIFLVSPDGGEPRQFTATPGAANNEPTWSPDGTQLAFSSNRGGHFDVWVQALDGTEARRLTEAIPPDRDLQWSPDGTQISFSSNRSDDRDNQDLFVVSVSGDRRERQITPTEGAAHEHGGRWSPSGSEIVFVSDSRGEDDIMVATIEGLLVTPIAQGEWEEQKPVWSPDGKRLAYLINRDGNSALVVKTLTSGANTIVETGLGVVSGSGEPQFTADGRSLVFIHTSGQEPADLVIAPTDGSAPARRITNSLAPFAERVEREWLVQPAIVRWQSADGTTVPGLLYRPHSAATTATLPPAILYVHGGPTGQTTNSWNPTIQYYVNHGYIVLAPNVRGSTGYGKAYREANLKDWGGGDLADLVAGANFLATEGLADRGRIGVTGGSYGGYMTLIALTKAPEVWAAGVSVVGIANLRTLYAQTRDDLQYYLLQQIGTPEENPQLYHDRSAINFVRQITAPLLILQGETDPRVPLYEAEQMRDLLEEYDKTYEYHVYAQEGHGFRREENRIDAAQRTVAFFDKYLKG